MADLPVVMSVMQVAECAGLARNTVYELIRRKELRAKKVGARLLIRREWFLDWLEQSDKEIAG